MTVKSKKIVEEIGPETVEVVQVMVPVPHLDTNERNWSRKAAAAVSKPEKINPLAAIAGSYASDPNWAEFLQVLEESRCEADEVVGAAG